MVECFSRLESLRCQGLTDTQHIITYLPSALSLLLVPALLALCWKYPRATIILLAIELLLKGTVDTWDLVTQLTPPTPNTFRSQDIALGAISSLPILFLLLFSTSFLISDLRGCLPSKFQSNKAVLLFSSIILPLVPAAFVATLLGNVLYIGYFSIGRKIQLGFERSWLRHLHDTLGVVGSATATVYLALVVGLAVLALTESSSRKRWIHEFQSTPALMAFSLGLLLVVLDVILALVRESFEIILGRRILGAVSRVILTIGLVGFYYPSGLGSRRSGIQLPLSPRRSGERKAQHSPSRPTRPSIGPPVVGSFHRMSHSATRSFQSANHRRDDGSLPTASSEGRPAKSRDRIILRNHAQRAPKLSITPSTFDQSDLASMADEVRGRDREALIQRSIVLNEDLSGGDNPFLTPEEQSERYRQIKRITGSIYKPTLIPVHEVHTPVLPDPGVNPFSNKNASTSGSGSGSGIAITDWPLPPDFHPRKGLSSWTAAASPDLHTPPSSWDHKVGQVAAYRTADQVHQLHPPPIARSNSGKRKPVPTYSEELDVPGDRSIAGHLSFISTSTSPAPDRSASPAVPSPASSGSRYLDREENERERETRHGSGLEAEPSSGGGSGSGSSGRPQKRRDTDPAHAVVPRSPDYGTSIYSDSNSTEYYPDDRALFFRPPLRSPSSSSPDKSTTFSPRVSLIPPSASGSGEGEWREDEPEMAMALSSLARVRRDTGAKFPKELELQPHSATSTTGGEGREGIDRSSTTTWSSDDLTPRASERGWWSGEKVDT